MRPGELWERSPLSQRAWVMQTVYNVLLGVALLAGGPERIAGPSFTMIREYGGASVWGSYFLVLGMLMGFCALGSLRLLAAVFLLAAVSHAWLAAMFVANAIDVPEAALTGGVTYTMLAFVHANFAISLRAEHRTTR